MEPRQNTSQLQPGHRKIRVEPAVRHALIEAPFQNPVDRLLRVRRDLSPLPGDGQAALHILPAPGGEAVEHHRQLAPGHRRSGSEKALRHAAADPHAVRPGHGVLIFLRHVGVRALVHPHQNAAETVEGLDRPGPAHRLFAVKAPLLPRGQQLPVKGPPGGVPSLFRNARRLHGPQIFQDGGGLFDRHYLQALPGCFLFRFFFQSFSPRRSLLSPRRGRGQDRPQKRQRQKRARRPTFSHGFPASRLRAKAPGDFFF